MPNAKCTITTHTRARLFLSRSVVRCTCSDTLKILLGKNFEDYFKGDLGALVRRALVKSRKTRETPRTRERNATIQARRKDFFVGLFSSMDSTDIQILLLHDVVFVDVRVARRVFSAPNFHQPSSSSARLLSLTPRCVLSFVSSLLFLVSNGLPATLTPRLVL